jgi:hypothetical protein
MKMESRKPRPSRFGTESSEARLVRLRETAPTLISNKKLRLYAVFGSVLMFLTVVAFYFAMQIYEVATKGREEASLIEVDQAPEIKLTETQKALARIEEQEVEQNAAYEAQVKALQEVDLLQEVEEPKP